MAAVTLHPDPIAFPVGTAVQVYGRSEPESPELKGKPPGALVTEPTVANDGSLKVEGLTIGAPYIGWSQRSSVDYYLRFRVDPTASSGGGEPSGPAGGDLTGEYPEPTIATGAVTAGKLGAEAVETAKVKASAITAAKIASEAVETAKIKDLAVTTAKLAAGAVTNAKIEAGTIEVDRLTTAAREALAGAGSKPTGAAGGSLAGEYPNPTFASNSVKAAQIEADAVETAKIKALAITAAKLAADAVETAKIKDGAVTAAKLASESVTSAKLASEAVEAAHIKAGAVGATQLASEAVTAAKIKSAAVEVSHLAAAVLTKFTEAQEKAEEKSLPRLKVKATAVTAGQALPYDELLRTDASGGTITHTLPASAGHVGQRVAVEKTDSSANEVIVEGEIRGASTSIALRLQNETAILVAAASGGWYTESKYLRVTTLDGRYIRAEAEAVLESQIKAGAVTAPKLASESVETAKITDAAVTAAKLATDAVTEAKIKDGAVTAAKIGAEAVTEAKIKDGAVTAVKRSKITLEVTRTFSVDEPSNEHTYAGFFVPSSGWSITRVDYEVLAGTSATFALIEGTTGSTSEMAEYKTLKAEKSHGEKATTVALTSGHKIDLKIVALNGGKALSVSVTMQKDV